MSLLTPLKYFNAINVIDTAIIWRFVSTFCLSILFSFIIFSLPPQSRSADAIPGNTRGRLRNHDGVLSLAWTRNQFLLNKD